VVERENCLSAWLRSLFFSVKGFILWSSSFTMCDTVRVFIFLIALGRAIAGVTTMPITLACPACSKRFKARDESAGKRVKCPYCTAAVTVPSPDDSASEADSTSATPPSPRPSPIAVSEAAPAATPLPAAAPTHPKAPVAAPPTPAAVATPDEWGAEPPPVVERISSRSTPPSPAAPAQAEPQTFPMMRNDGDKSKKGGRTKRATTNGLESKSPDQLVAGAWKKARGGLFWVLFALFFLALPGFVGFAKTLLPRLGVELPRGEGWSIPGYVNSKEEGAVHMTKMEQIDVLAYAAPVFLAGLALSFGRLTCGAAPRNSGARGMFACSGLFTFLALAGLVTAGVCKLLLFDETRQMAGIGFLILGSVAEFWFLSGLVASGVALKRPRAARAVGLIAFFFGLLAAVATVGWKLYEQKWRPKTLDDDWKLYEQAALMLGWILVIGVYWRAVGSVRGAISEFLESVEA
jgi:hypothetical protein